MTDTSNDTGLLDQVTSLTERCQAMRLVVLEDTERFELDNVRIRTLEALLEVGLAVTGQVIEHYDETADTEPVGILSETESLRAIGEQISTELASREVSDLAFVGYSQIRRALDRLRGVLAGDDPWVVMAQADTAHRHLAKALIALESALREFHGLEPVLRQWVAIEDSLEIRRAYGQFRRIVAALDSEAETRGLTSVLCRAGRHLGSLQDRSIYPYLRIEDRVEIRRLQQRIADWLAEVDGHGEVDAGIAADAATGRQLWQDLVAFAELIQQVNDRQELVEHDREVAARALLRLATADSDGLPSAAVVEALGDLLGRDRELDGLLLAAAPAPTRDWRAVVHRIQERLGDP